VRIEKSNLLLVALACLSFIVRIAIGPHITDDAYITFRYARNIVEGAGFVYNPGEHVLGTTTPSYTLILSLFAAILSPAAIPWIAVTLNALSDALSAILVFKLGKQFAESDGVAWTSSISFAFAPLSVTAAMWGMETSFYTMLLLLAYYFGAKGATHKAAFVSGLALLTRPEASILVLLIFGSILIVKKKIPFSELGLFLVLVVPWLVFSWLYFGSPVPNSFTAKATKWSVAQPETSAWVVFAWYLGALFTGYHPVTGTWHLARIIFNAVLIIIGVTSATRARKWKILLFFSYPLLYIAVSLMLEAGMFPWYVMPLQPFAIMAVVMGLAQLARLIAADGRWFRHLPVRSSTAFFLLLWMVPLTMELSEYEFVSADESRLSIRGGMIGQREELYRRAALELAPQVTVATRIATSEIGSLGYHSQAYILDTAGLVSPIAISYFPLEVYTTESGRKEIPEIPLSLVLDLEPDYVVAPEMHVRGILVGQPPFEEAYELVKVVGSPQGTEGVLIFQKRSR
jgi:hypothetical protein